MNLGTGRRWLRCLASKDRPQAGAGGAGLRVSAALSSPLCELRSAGQQLGRSQRFSFRGAQAENGTWRMTSERRLEVWSLCGPRGGWEGGEEGRGVLGGCWIVPLALRDRAQQVFHTQPCSYPVLPVWRLGGCMVETESPYGGPKGGQWGG